MRILFSPKKIAMLVVFFVASVFVIIFFSSFRHKNPNVIANTQHVFQNPSFRAQREAISPRNAQIENYLSFPDKFPSAKINEKILHLVAYPPSLPTEKVQNFDGVFEARSGFLVYDEKKEIWETSENIIQIQEDQTQFKDLTGDGIPEIVSVDEGGGNEPTCITRVYKWKGDGFTIISPDYFNPCEGSDPSKGGIKDMDGDGVFELVGFRMDWADPNNPQVDKRKEIELIYKFDGSVYKLWKEIDVTHTTTQ